MSDSINMDRIRGYFADKLERFGTTPRGVDWNSETSQEVRFAQLAKVIDPSASYTIVDYGSGFGSMYDFLVRRGDQLEYWGYDIVDEMVAQGKKLHAGNSLCHFIAEAEDLPEVDYCMESGMFNIKLDVPYEQWTAYCLEILKKMDSLCTKGFSFNMLTRYSDADHMRPDLYYADPCFMFDYCKRNFSKNVALLHDYGVYDFTILVRKSL